MTKFDREMGKLTNQHKEDEKRDKHRRIDVLVVERPNQNGELIYEVSVDQYDHWVAQGTKDVEIEWGLVHGNQKYVGWEFDYGPNDDQEPISFVDRATNLPATKGVFTVTKRKPKTYTVLNSGAGRDYKYTIRCKNEALGLTAELDPFISNGR